LFSGSDSSINKEKKLSEYLPGPVFIYFSPFIQVNMFAQGCASTIPFLHDSWPQFLCQ
jgi:hypothetical protein